MQRDSIFVVLKLKFDCKNIKKGFCRTINMTSNEELQNLFKNLELELATSTLTREKLEQFLIDISKLAEDVEGVDKELLENMKNFMIDFTSKLEFDGQKRSRRDVSKHPNTALINNVKPMMVLWTGFFVGTAASVVIFKKPLNMFSKTILTTFVAKASEKGFEKAYDEFKKLEF